MRSLASSFFSVACAAGGAMACFALFSPSAFAAPFTNGSFESATNNPGTDFLRLAQGSTVITGWTVTAGSVDYVGTRWQAAEGLRSVDLDGAVGANGAISQTFDTNTGLSYEVRFALAGNTENPPTIKTSRVTAANASADYSFNITGRSNANMGYIDQLFTFTATSTSTTLTFLSLTSPAGFGPVIDNVRVNAVTAPEPGSIALTLLGGLGLMGVVVRRRKA